MLDRVLTPISDNFWSGSRVLPLDHLLAPNPINTSCIPGHITISGSLASMWLNPASARSSGFEDVRGQSANDARRWEHTHILDDGGDIGEEWM